MAMQNPVPNPNPPSFARRRQNRHGTFRDRQIRLATACQRMGMALPTDAINQLVGSMFAQIEGAG